MKFRSHEIELSKPQHLLWKHPNGIVIPKHSFAATPFTSIRVNQDTTHEPQNECSVAVNPNNKLNMVCTFRDFRYGGGENGSLAIRNVGIATTTDGGTTWSEQLAQYSDHNRYSDPDVAVDSAGTFSVVTLDFYCPSCATNYDSIDFSVRQSMDNGLSWNPALQTDYPPTSVSFHDKEMIAAKLPPDGTIKGNIYVAGDEANGTASESSLNGSIFTPPVSIQPYYPTPATGLNNDVFVTGYTSGIGLQKSTDGGQTFSPSMDIEGIYTPSSVAIDGTISSIGEPVVCVDKSNSVRRGNVYVTWQSRYYGDGDIFCTASTDGGATWAPGVRVNNDTVGNGRDQFHHWMTVDDSGFIDVVFLDRRNDPSNTLCDAYFAQSRDGGKSFKNFRLTQQNFDPRLYPSYDARLGDYMGIGASQGRVVPIWVDTRSGNEDIYITNIDQDQAGSIQGTVYAACYGGNAIDSTVRMAGFSVTIAHDGGFNTALTDSNGHYRFDGLFAGDYNISVASHHVFLANNGAYTIHLASTQAISNQDFAVKSASVTGVGYGWSLISLPGAPHDVRADAIFSNLAANVFAYNHRYTQRDSLVTGLGYWIKPGCIFAEDSLGTPILADTIPLSSGWNLVGALGVTISVGSAQTNPPGAIIGNIYGYSDSTGYTAADSLLPARGYWLKSSESASLILSSGTFASPMAKASADLATMNSLIIV
ncbi:MAG TPA: hypothetical protein VKS81_07050, partial [Bacteroidota bacterium]|nr:hypothetical protein [Bacteroidota bacterium]